MVLQQHSNCLHRLAQNISFEIVTKVGKKNVISAAWPLGHVTPLWLLKLRRQRLLTIPLQVCPSSDDASCFVPRLNGPEEQRQVMQQLITPQRHEGNHSAVSHMCTLRAQTLLMNPKRFYWLSLFSWISFESWKKMQNLTSRAGSIQEWRARAFSRSLKLFRFGHSNAQTHFIISFVCLLWWCLSDLVSVRELERSMKSLVMAPAHFLHIFPPFVEKMAMIRVTPQDATAHNWKKEFKVSYEITSV